MRLQAALSEAAYLRLASRLGISAEMRLRRRAYNLSHWLRQAPTDSWSFSIRMAILALRWYIFSMLYRKHRVGLDINAYCGKCRSERTHTIAAMDGDMVRKVTCSMCNGTHNYKVKEPMKKKAHVR